MAELHHPRFNVLTVIMPHRQHGYVIYDAQQRRYNGVYYVHQHALDMAAFYNNTDGYAFPDLSPDFKPLGVILPSTP